jgi:predicted transposase/invertase (TIGR01784 family)
MKNLKTISFSSGLENATGEIPEKLTNDVVLHSITQNNNEVLRGLTAALLMVPVSSVTNVVLLNPIDYRNYTDKEIILDIKAQIDGRKIMNIELQMLLSTDSTWWINRSLLYLCRTYDNLEGGADYTKIRPSMQVSIVCKDLFSDVEPEFYAQYYLENVRNRHVYTRDFSLRVLYLNHIDLATKEDKENELDYWAQAFLAKTWDELKSLAEKAEVFREVAESMYTVNADVSQRSIAEAHRKYVETYTTLKNCLERAEQHAAEAEKRADDAEAEVKRLREELAQLKAEKRDL